MSAPEDNPADDEPPDEQGYDDWLSNERQKEQEADEDAQEG